MRVRWLRATNKSRKVDTRDGANRDIAVMRLVVSPLPQRVTGRARQGKEKKGKASYRSFHSTDPTRIRPPGNCAGGKKGGKEKG